MTKLITFGCSWTWGVGANWLPSMSEQEYQDGAWHQSSANNAFRTKLAKQFNLENVNFSKGGYSNQASTRKAREYLTKGFHKDEIVLWGITSTARNEFYVADEEIYTNIKFGDGNACSRGLEQEEIFFLNAYSHKNEVKILAEEMQLWNAFFEHNNIPVIWYDTFNTHEYPIRNKNLIQGDLLTLMLEHENINVPEQKFYHFSSWRNDDPRITAGVKAGLLNPITYHPTNKGHDVIVQILTPYIQEKL